MISRSIPDGISESSFQHFSTHPLAISTLNDDAFELRPMSREITHDGHGHTLMAGTFNSEHTIPHLLSFFRPSSNSTPIGDEYTRAEVRRFYTFGGGLNAHPDLLHGGVIACILDSTMGNVIGFSIPRKKMFTVQLNIKYEKPVKTPGTVRTRAWISKIQDDRKIWVNGIVEGDDITYAKAEGMWLSTKPKGNEKL